MRGALAILSALTVSACISANAPAGGAATRNLQLAASVQHDLNLIGLSESDARTLTTQQLSAIYLQLGDGEAGAFGPKRWNARQRVLTILERY